MPKEDTGAFTWGKIGALAAAIFLTALTVAGLIIAFITDDIAAIRQDVDSLEAKADATITDVNQKDGNVKDQLAEHTTQIALSAKSIQDSAASLSGLTTVVQSSAESMVKLQATVDAMALSISDMRVQQNAFQVWVVAQLGSPQAALPADWSAINQEITKSVLFGNYDSSPLFQWADSIKSRN